DAARPRRRRPPTGASGACSSSRSKRRAAAAALALPRRGCPAWPGSRLMPVRPPLRRPRWSLHRMRCLTFHGREEAGGPGSSEDDPPGPATTPETVVTDGVCIRHRTSADPPLPSMTTYVRIALVLCKWYETSAGEVLDPPQAPVGGRLRHRRPAPAGEVGDRGGRV